jgi:hypothetical protein
VHHLADSHANSFIRFKLALTEDWPTIKPYDEAAWARLADSGVPIDGSLAFIDALHQRWVALLESMSEEDFLKGYVHPENGRQNLARALAIYEWHGRHHTAHITGLRAQGLVGAPRGSRRRCRIGQPAGAIHRKLYRRPSSRGAARGWAGCV